MTLKSTLLIVLLCLSQADIVPFNKDTFAKIYQENQVFLIYVHGDTHNFQAESIFNSNCFGQKLCAILDPNNPDYDQLLQFIGYEEEEFFIIFDPSTQRKYVSSITDNYTQNDLLSFEYRYTFNELQPFFASEPAIAGNSQVCTKLVGKTVGEFLRRSERVKVVLLFHLNEHCWNCDEILQKFIPFAEKNYDEKKLAFGYFDTFLNDNPVIQDEKVPTFLIFIDEQFQRPFQLDPADIEELSDFLAKTLNVPKEKPEQKQQEPIEDISEEL